jgi:rhodanese-related sulfurtransferase
MRLAGLVLALLVIIAPATVGPVSAGSRVAVEGGGSYADVTPAELNAMLGKKDFVLVNVHVPYAGEIAPTDRFIPFDAIEAGLRKLSVRKGAKVVLYCRSGAMSAIAARALVRAGYTDVSNLAGGMVAWEGAGLPLARRPR